MIPSLPNAPFLHEALQSIENQSLVPKKVVVVINGFDSFDSSELCEAAICVRMFEPFATAIFAEKAGQAEALKLGISMVDDEFVAFLDADDLWTPQKQGAQIEILLDNPEVDAVNCVVQNFSGNPASPIELRKSLGTTFPATTFRRAVFESHAPIEDREGWLFKWFLDARSRGLKMASWDEVGLLRRVHSSNGWVTNREETLSDLTQIIRDKASGIAR